MSFQYPLTGIRFQMTKFNSPIEHIKICNEIIGNTQPLQQSNIYLEITFSTNSYNRYIVTIQRIIYQSLFPFQICNQWQKMFLPSLNQNHTICKKHLCIFAINDHFNFLLIFLDTSVIRGNRRNSRSPGNIFSKNMDIL